MKSPLPSITAEQICAAFILDAPVPIRVLYGLYGSRSTFHVWKRLGLDVKTVPGMGPTVLPSSFKRFLLEQRGDWAPQKSPATN
jgi:hypothetical protein